MNDATEAALVEARAEVETLRSENVRLRDLLGLNTRETDGHRHAWAPTLFTQSAASATIDSASPQDDKLALLRSLFGARVDVHALRWESASTGKSGWSPAVRGGWSNKRARKEYLPLTDEVFASHLRGETTVGV